MVDAQKALNPVPDDKLAFWFSNGTIIRSLEDLANVLDKLPSDIFKYHVNRDKNDVAAWVMDVFADETLAEVIKSEIDQKRMAEKVKRHLAFLKKPVLVPPKPVPVQQVAVKEKKPKKKHA